MDPTRRSIGFYRRRYPTIGSSSHPLQYTLRGEDSGTIEFRGSDRHKVNFTQKPQHCLIKATSGFISHPPTRGFLGYKASKDQTSFTANGDKQDQLKSTLLRPRGLPLRHTSTHWLRTRLSLDTHWLCTTLSLDTAVNTTKPRVN